MATQGICNSFKQELLEGTPHDLDAATGTYKMALYAAASTIAPGTATYPGNSVNNQVATSGTYSQGGANVTTSTVGLTNGVAHWTPGANLSWSSVTWTDVSAALLYKATSNETVAVFTFATQQVSNGTFTLQMPTDDNNTGLVRIA